MQSNVPSITEITQAGSFGLRLPKLPSNPFVGLRPFKSDEALLYFGRREQTIELLRQLDRTHFVALVGSSGCGKSSLVYAGLIPKLEAGFLVEERDQWLIARMKPGDDPLQNLAAALSPHSTAEPASLDASIRASDVAALLESLTPTLTRSDANLLLLIDQFEELFRFGLESGKRGNRAEATCFVELMLALSEQRQLPIYVVMTMRSDFIGDCDNFYGLPEAMNRSQYLVPRLTDKQLRQAIEGPIHLFGANITPRLLDRVLNDVGDKSDQLPVMQHALMRTWEQWQKRAFVVPPSGGGDSESEANRLKAQLRTPLDVEHYEAVGTLTEALSRDAEAALESLSEENQKIAERMFQVLTDTDARNRQIRRPAHLSELCAITGTDRKTIEAIIEEFSGSGRSFLTQTNEADPLINISHESLIRNWDKLNEWTNKEIESKTIYLRIADAAELHEKGQTRLWTDPQLQLTLNWLEENNPNQAWSSRYDPAFNRAMTFLDESRKARNAEVLAKQQQQKKERYLTISGIVFGITSVFLILFAWQQMKLRDEAEVSSKQMQKLVNEVTKQEQIAQEMAKELNNKKLELETAMKNMSQQSKNKVEALGAALKNREKILQRLNDRERREYLEREANLSKGEAVTYRHPVVGNISYKGKPNGTAVILGDWIDKNTVPVDAPELKEVGVRNVKLYKPAAIQMKAALKKIRERGLLNRISWVGSLRLVPQLEFIDISSHSLGIAFDIRIKGNSNSPDRDLRDLISIFKDYKFKQGTSGPLCIRLDSDIIHFEYKP
ncbi:MAG: ATP-binding protein [Acidobacteria bacterium]|nr:ATP-binding protein [Acidobacteriota bacterium]